MKRLVLFLVVSAAAWAQQATFKITSLGTTATIPPQEHYAVTGDDHGGIAISNTSVYYTGDASTGQFNIDSLAGTALGVKYDGLVSDLSTGQVYTLANGITPVVYENGHAISVTHLQPLPAGSGAAVRLSIPVTLHNNAGIFSGFGRAVFLDGTAIYDLDLSTGQVTQSTLPAAPSWQNCESWATWGVAEYFGGSLYLDYAAANGKSITRLNVSNGTTSNILSLSGSQPLGDMCSFTVSPAKNRWYFHFEGQSIFFGGSTDKDHDEFIGYAPATFEVVTDHTPPSTTLTPATSPNGNGWYKAAVTVNISAADTGGSGVKNTQCSINGADSQVVGSSVQLNAEGKNTLRCFSTDNAGNVESPAVTVSVNIDTIAPVITFTNRTAANDSGWNKANVDVNWSCTDSGSGVVLTAVTETISTEGKNQSATGTCTDLAGNSTSNTQTGINLDKTAPGIQWGTPLPAANTAGWNNTNVSVPFTVTDSLSGLAEPAPASPLTIAQEGTGLTASVTVTDLAGNSATYTTAQFKIDKTAPVITLQSRTAANSAGWNNADVAVTWACTDTLSGPVSATVSKSLTGEGQNQSVTGACADNAGNSASDTQTGFNIDKTAPTLTFGTATPAPNGAGWNNTDVTVPFTASDNLSGLAPASPTSPLVLNTEGLSVMGTITLSDLAGNTATFKTAAFKIDKTKPVATAAASPGANENGWNNASVTVSFTGTDSLSGIASCSDPVVLSNDGANQSAQGTCTDNAGNASEPAVKSGVNIDKTPPTITLQSRTAANPAGWNNADVTVVWACTDTLSQPVSATVSKTLTGEGQNQSTVGTCTDRAGNTASDTQTGINIDKTPPVIGGSRLPLANAAGWNNTDVTATFACSDSLSGLVGTWPQQQVIKTEGANQSATAACSDVAGNSATTTVSGISIDKTPPLVSSSQSPDANAAGWNNTDVTVTFAGTDNLSGIAACTPPVTIATEVAQQQVIGGCTDAAGNSNSVTRIVSIDKTPPIAPTLVLANPNPVAVSTPLTISASTSDTPSFSRIAGAQYQIGGGDWISMAAADGQFNTPTENVTANLLAFNTAGVYSLCVRAIDVAGNVGPSDCTYLVIYDPSGGFVTGGGWITSPAGAYSIDTSLSGRANFGFVSKYQKGATVPVGDTEFDFKVANLNFKSTSYNWLVISGARAQYKGSGKINGSGDFSFLLTVIDGQLSGGGGSDKFRIKIWDTASGTTVYDNQTGVGDDADPTTTLGGGSIVIHK